MSKDIYPSGEDLQKFLTGFPFVVGQELDFAGAIGEAAGIWELEVGWRPFLMKSEVEARVFRVSHQKVFCYGASSVGTVELVGGLIRADKVLIRNKTILKEGKDYCLYADTSHSSLDSFHWMEILKGWNQSDLIEVTGIWGACTRLPLEVWRAILKKGAAEVLASLGCCSLDMRLESWSEGGVTERYGPSLLSDLIVQWNQNFNRMIRLHRRISVLG